MEKVRAPREPKLEPPPIRASAAGTAADATIKAARPAATVVRSIVARCVEVEGFIVLVRKRTERRVIDMGKAEVGPQGREDVDLVSRIRDRRFDAAARA